jgi:hypothetical protein
MPGKDNVVESDKQLKLVPNNTEPWDPLARVDEDIAVYAAAQKREIKNILKSYTGYFDLFAEMLQNSLDAVEKRKQECELGYKPRISVTINIKQSEVTVVDNGCAMVLAQFRQFLKPSLSFKDGSSTRGNKGVGATYLAFGFNHLEVATKIGTEVYAGVLRNGRSWLDDNKASVPQPTVEPLSSVESELAKLDRGTSIKLKLSGKNIRPKSLQYFAASTAFQWSALLRAHSPLGGIYLCGEAAPEIDITLRVIDEKGIESTEIISKPHYLYPHEVMGKVVDVREYLADRLKRVEKGQDVAKVPPKFSGQNGMWGVWSSDEILTGKALVNPRLTEDERELMKELRPKVYAFMCYTTDLWDAYSDDKLKLRKNYRLLRGGIQLATKHMPQGGLVPIPLTNNIGFQQITHVVVHLENAEPDLGRKGFQPEHTALAETLGRAVVPAMRRYFQALLKRNIGAPQLLQEMKISQWIDNQKEHEKKFPLIISGKGLFRPLTELAIKSEPLVEQDVVALFNQMLSSGFIRGVQLISSSQFHQYDGLFRWYMKPPFEQYTRSSENPLGVDEEQFANQAEALEAPLAVLEYKYNLDSLIDEFDNDLKKPADIRLAVCWELGHKWKEHFTILSLLDDENVHHRAFHGVSHVFSHAVSGAIAFSVIALKDIVSYVSDPARESASQKLADGEAADLDGRSED